jgi:hypothetical protein
LPLHIKSQIWERQRFLASFESKLLAIMGMKSDCFGSSASISYEQTVAFLSGDASNEVGFYESYWQHHK